MRTFEEIQADIVQATSINDAEALRALATEVQGLGTPQAEALAFHTMGVVSNSIGDFPLALEYSGRALANYETLGNRSGVAAVANNTGSVYKNTGGYQLALEHYARALAIHVELNNRAGVAVVTGNMGNVYINTGDYPSALEHYRRALAMHEELDDRAGVARVTGNIGNVFTYTGNYPSALEHYRRALAVHEELGDRSGVARVVGNMGNVYKSTSNYPLALEHYRRALMIHEELGEREDVARVVGNIGTVYQSTGDYPLALEHYSRALALHEELGSRAGIARVTGFIGIVFQSTGDYHQALEYHRRTLAMNEELDERANAARSTGNMIYTLIKLDRYEEAEELLVRQAALHMDNPGVRALHHSHKAVLAEHRNDLDAAQDQLLEALTITTATGLRSESAQYHERLRDLAQKRNDFAGYIEHNNEYLRLSEEIRGKEATSRLALMDVEQRIEAEFRERDKERALLYSALPETIASRMLRGEDVSGDHFEHVSVIFLDIAGFTAISDRIPPGHVVHLLEQIFSALDDVCAEHGVTKIKTIGDSYLAVAFPETGDRSSENVEFDREQEHAQRAAACAVEMMTTMNTLQVTMPPELGDTSWIEKVGDLNVRIGVHCGPVTAGVIGKERLQYDIWGDTVNVASRMESTGEPGRIQCSESFALGLGARGEGREDTAADSSPAPRPFTLALRGAIEIKGKGTMTTYWLEPAE